MDKLIQIRIKSFFAEAGVMVAVAVLGVFTSPLFNELVTKFFGETATAGVIILVVTGVAKHLLNLQALKNLGAEGKEITLI